MKIRKLSRIAVTAIITAMISVIFAFDVFATGTAEFSIPSTAVAKGSTFSVSIKMTADADIGFVTGMVSFDESVIEFQPSDNASAGGGVITLNGFPDAVGKEMTFTLNFKALNDGKTMLNLTNCYITSDDGTQIGSPTAYASITVGTGVSDGSQTTENPDSSNDDLGDPNKGYLTELTVSPGTLKPAFSYDIYDYYVDVDNSVEYCEVEGKTANTTDQIWYTGNENLAVGKNVRTIKVTDTDGNYHIYTITITRAESNEESSSEIVTESQQSEVSEESSTATVIIDDDKDGGMEKYRKMLMPALIIILVTIIIAIVVILTWLRKKSDSKKHSSRKR